MTLQVSAPEPEPPGEAGIVPDPAEYLTDPVDACRLPERDDSSESDANVGVGLLDPPRRL